MIVFFHSRIYKFGNRTGFFYAGRTAADNDDSHKSFSQVFIDFYTGSTFKRTNEMIAQKCAFAQGFHRIGMFFYGFHAEIICRSTSCND